MKTKTYHTTPVSGYFANVSSIERLAVLHDAPSDPETTELQTYFNDLYQVFLHRLSEYAITDTVPEKEEDRLAGMFLELIKTKRTLRGEDQLSA
jgi:hypothetical protein